MNFHSVQFVVFLALALASFWTVSRRRGARAAVLLVGSYFFYGCYDYRYLGLIAFSTVLDWFCGNAIHRAGTQGRRTTFLLVSLIGNLGLLSFFKYYDWGVSSLQLLGDELGWTLPLEPLGIIVPVGISFYTFQTLSYTIDIYRGVLRPARTFSEFALFVSFFPQLVAGPIVRAVEFLPQLEIEPRFDRSRLHDGLYRIALGLAKKVAIADTLGGYIVDPVYGAPSEYAWWVHLVALYGFTFQIYFDFSGYSDIAIGAARLFGFDLPENFDLPYQSRSIREFWRRWHISLSSWVRDYIYFPLGGSRGSELRVSANLITTMLIIGLWHGASILWVIYGLLQGLVMCGERFFERLRGGREFATTPLKSAVSWFATFHFIVFSCLFIRAKSWDEVVAMLREFGGVTEVSPWVWAALIGGAFTHFQRRAVLDWIQARACALPTFVLGVVVGVVCGFVAYLVVGDTPYIYFQF